MPSTAKRAELGRPPVTSGAASSPRKPTSLKRPLARVRITYGGRSPEYPPFFASETTAPIAGNTSPPPGSLPVCIRYAALSCPNCVWVIVRMTE